MDSADALNWAQTIGVIVSLVVSVLGAVWTYKVSRSDRKEDAAEREREYRRRMARVLELGEAAVTAVNKAGEMDRFLAAKRNLNSALTFYVGSSLVEVEALAKPAVNPAMTEKGIDGALLEIREELNRVS